MSTFSSFLFRAVTCLAMVASAEGMAHCAVVPLSRTDNANHVVAPPKSRNLLGNLGDGFYSPWWNQGDKLNGTAYGVSMALSIDAAAFLGQPIIFDPDSVYMGPATVEDCVRSLNHRNYLKEWRTPSSVNGTLRTVGFSWIKVTRLTNGENTKDAIKNAIDNNQAVVFTYNFTKDDCGGVDGFFSLKFNSMDRRRHPYDSNHDSMYDGCHTMCVVGYDDGDGTFIVQDSRSALRPLFLPGMDYCGAWTDGTVKIPQDIGYTETCDKFDKRHGAFRHEFFTLMTSWVGGDRVGPTFGDMAMDTSDGADEPGRYRITTRIQDDTKVAGTPRITISIPGAGDFPLHGVYSDNVLSCDVPILGPDSMSPPVEATVTIAAGDTSGNESEAAARFHFASGLPLPFFANASGSSTGLDAQALMRMDASASPGWGRGGGPIFSTNLNLTSFLVPTFLPSEWNQTMPNCTAYGSLVALSIDISQKKGVPIVFDPDSTATGGIFIYDYVAFLNQRKYLQDWSHIQNAGLPQRRYYWYDNITYNQIVNDSNTKTKIKTALDNQTPVAFSYYYSDGIEDSLSRFWYGSDPVFCGIDRVGNNYAGEGHTMCIAGYDNLYSPSAPYETTFIVQNSWGLGSVVGYVGGTPIHNRPDGTLRIPQDIDYTKRLNFGSSSFPRYEFYKLAGNWKAILPVEIHDLEINVLPIPPPVPLNTVLNEFTVWVENTVPIASVSVTKSTNGGATLNVSHEFWNDVLKWKIAFKSLPASIVFTVTVVDTSGNTHERRFNVTVVKGWATVDP